MCVSDKYPTQYNLKPIVLNESTSLSITELEQRALHAVNLAERISEPVNRFSLARSIVRGVALIARARRDRLGGEER